MVKKDLVVEHQGSVSDRITYVVLQKKNKFASKLTATGVKIHRMSKKQSQLAAINIYAPPMGRVQKNPELQETF